MPDIDETGISLEEMLGRRKAFDFTYYGHKCHIEYFVEKVTGNFSSDLVRFLRKSAKLSQQARGLMQGLVDAINGAAPVDVGEIENGSDDPDDNAALEKLRANDKALRHDMAVLLADVVAEWDLTEKGAPYAISIEHIERLDDAYLAEVIGGILRGGQPMGEANGKRNLKRLPSSLRPKARRVS